MDDSTQITSKGIDKTTNANKKINHDPDAKVTYHVQVDENDWEKIAPVSVTRKDRITYKLKQGWTHFIINKLWENYRIPCPFAFKKHAFPVKSNTYLTFYCTCNECGNSIEGSLKKKPEVGSLIVFEIRTNNTRGLVHESNTYLSSNRRVEERKKLEHTKAKRYVDEQAADILNDSGTKPPYYVKETVARTVRQEAKDIKIGIDKYSSNPVTAILQQMDHDESIREFVVDPVQIYYWSSNQIILWNDANKLHLPISIDATGCIAKRLNIVDDVESSPIFLYNVTIRISAQVFSICQMLSSQHDSGTIAEWLEAWIESGASIPSQVIADCSCALLIAICFVFNNCDYFEYNDRCHRYVSEYRAKEKTRKDPTELIVMSKVLPSCRTMRDRAHLLKSTCKWKCFTIGQNWIKKDLYVRAIAFCLEIENMEEMEAVIIALFVLCESECFDEGSNCFQQYLFLKEKITTFNHKKFGLYELSEGTCEEQHCSFLREFDIAEDAVLFSANTIKLYLSDLKSRSQKLIHEDAAKNYTKSNPYWLPAILNNLLRLFREYPSWTNVTRRFYPFDVNPVATSTDSEVYFRILKLDYELMCLSLHRFLIQHLKLLKGATRNGIRELKQFISKLDLSKEKGVIAVDMEEQYIVTDDPKDQLISQSVLQAVKIHNESLIERDAFLKNNHEPEDAVIQQIFNINRGNPLKFDILMAFYNYHLPYKLKDSGCVLTLNAFMSLKPKRFIHGEIIDCMMCIWKKRPEWQDIFYIPTTQTNFIVGDECHKNHPSEWIMYHLNFQFFGKVFLPFCYAQHWCLLVLNVNQKIMYYFDPLYNDTKDRPVIALKSFLKRCKDIIEKKLSEKIEINNLPFIDWEETGLNNDRDVQGLPRQLDGWNCGILIIYYIAVLSGLTDVSKYRKDHDSLRIFIANLLLREFDVNITTCLFCYNQETADGILFCTACHRWSHRSCVMRHRSKLAKGVCELCLEK